MRLYVPKLWVSISDCPGSQDADTKRTLTLLSPPAVARRPLPCGSKWAEYMGAFSLCQDTRSGAAFIVDGDGAHVPFGMTSISCRQHSRDVCC